ncbi:MAG: hypothetical protein ACE5HI_07510 [bacterium]
MSTSKKIGVYTMILTSAIWVGCNECNTFAPTRYYSQFSMRGEEAKAVPETNWRFGFDLREEACPQSSLEGNYTLSFDGGFMSQYPMRDFPLFEQDLDVDSISIEGLGGNFKATRILKDTKSGFYLNLPANETQSQTYIVVDEPSSGCFLLTPKTEIPFVIAPATVQFPECKLNESGELYAVIGSGENEKPLSPDDLRTFYDDNIGVSTTLNFDKVKIPRKYTQIQVRFVVKLVNHFTSEVSRILPVDVTLDRQDDSYQQEP